MDDLDALASEDGVEVTGELAVAIANQEANRCRSPGQGPGELTCLLGAPGAAGIGRAAGDLHPSAAELDEEEHVVATERDRLDGEEVAGEHARGLLAEEVPPARPRASRRRPKTGCEQ